MKKSKSIEFKGTVATLSTLSVTLRSNKIDELGKDLAALCSATPDFFSQDIALLDAAALPGRGTEIDWTALVSLLRAVRLNPVAVRHAAPEAEERIRAAGLNLAEEIEVMPRKVAAEAETKAATEASSESTADSTNNSTPNAATEAKPAAASQAAPVPAAPTPPERDQKSVTSADAVPAPAAAAPKNPLPAATVVVDRPLRSGQQVYARNADLVVLAMVNPGAEVMADGNIHVYAPLRGRAMAGASGNTSARILTTCFEAELVSVGGVYRPLEPGMPKDVSGKPAQVRLVDGPDGKQSLLIEALKIV